MFGIRLNLFIIYLAVFLPVVSVQANTEAFRAKVYDVMDVLQASQYGKFREAVRLLTVTKDVTTKSEAQDEVIHAIKMLSGRSKEDSSDLVDKVNAHLQSALTKDRFLISEDKAMGIEALEKLLLVQLLGNIGPKIKFKTNNINKAEALSLLLTYLTDRRSAKYDPDVKELISGSSDKGLFFVLPDEPVAAPEGVNKRDFVNELKAQVKELVPADGTIQFKVKLSKLGEILIHAEVKGLEAIGFIETWVRNPLMLANGNRYMFAAANGLESLSTKIKSQYLGNNTSVQKLAQTFATKVLDPAEDVLRNRLISEKWSPASVGMVKKQLEQQTNITIEHMKKNLEMRLERLKGAFETPEEIASTRARTETYIKNAEDKLKQSLANIDKAVQDLEKTEVYLKASPEQRSAMRVAAAEKTGGTKLWNWQTSLRYVSLVIATYYIYEWVIQTYRNDDPKLTPIINEKYGVKFINTMLYIVPVIGEAAIAIDYIGNLAVNFILKQAEVKLRIPSVEEILQFGIDGMVSAGLALRGIREFDVTKSELMHELKISSFKDGSGAWHDRDLIDKAMLIRDDQNLTAENKQAALAEELKVVAGKHIILFYELNSKFPDELDRLGRFHEELLGQWRSGEMGLVNNSYSLLMN